MSTDTMRIEGMDLYKVVVSKYHDYEIIVHATDLKDAIKRASSFYKDHKIKSVVKYNYWELKHIQGDK